MLLSLAACGSSSKKKSDDDDDDESEESGEAINNDFEGTYEADIDLLDAYCYIVNYSIEDAKDAAKEMDTEYTVIAVFDIKEDTLDLSFGYNDDDIEDFVNEFYAAAASKMFDEDEIDEKLEEAEEAIDSDISELKDFFSSSEKGIPYEFDGESELTLNLSGYTIEFDIDLGNKKFTVDDAESNDSDVQAFADFFKDVTFKKVANFEGGNKDNSSADTSKDESKDESKVENSQTESSDVPSNRPSDIPSDVPSDVPSILPPQDSSDVIVDNPSGNDEMEGTYVGEINLLDVYYALNGQNNVVYNAEPYMDATYKLAVVIEINNGVMSLDITEDNAIIDAFVQSFAYGYLKYSFPNFTEEQLDAAVAQMAGDIASDQASLKALIGGIYFANMSYTFDGSSELKVDVGGDITIFNIIVNASTGNFEIFSIYDEAYNNETELEAILGSVEFVKQ